LLIVARTDTPASENPKREGQCGAIAMIKIKTRAAELSKLMWHDLPIAALLMIATSERLTSESLQCVWPDDTVELPTVIEDTEWEPTITLMVPPYACRVTKCQSALS
jgi:hypothetical protein